MTARFEPRMLAGLDEPVRRYLTHAVAEGAPLSRGARVALSGHIRVGLWLRFSSVWEGDGRSLSWEATAGWGHGTGAWSPFFRCEVTGHAPLW